MKILGYISHAWPGERGGSSVALHRTLAWFAGRGHEVRVIVLGLHARTTDGVEYHRAPRSRHLDEFGWADVVVSQFAAVRAASELAAKADIPAVHLLHNLHFIHSAKWQGMRPDRDLVVWNSDAMSLSERRLWKGRSTVLHPPVWPAAPVRGDRVVQVNLSAIKGGETFWRVADRLPDIGFTGITGGWGHQLAWDGATHRHPNAHRRMSNRPANVDIIPTTTDMDRDFWPLARVLMVPTGVVNEYQTGESYSLVAAEASARGIPVVATWSPGIAEAAPNATFCAPGDIDAWAKAVTAAIDAPPVQAHRDPTPELLALEAAMGTLT